MKRFHPRTDEHDIPSKQDSPCYATDRPKEVGELKTAILKHWAEKDLQAYIASWQGAKPSWKHQEVKVHPARWKQKTTQESYPNISEKCAAALTNLPERLSRETLFQLARRVSDEDTALEFFLQVMAWGHNKASYGPSRTYQVLNNTKVAESIHTIISAARKRQLKIAFEEIHRSECGTLVLKGLGTSFGSKLIYFAGFSTRRDAPLIFDHRVEKGLDWVLETESGSSGLSSQTTQFSVYQSYLDMVTALRDRYVPDARRDMVEDWLWWVGGWDGWHLQAMWRTGKWLGELTRVP